MGIIYICNFSRIDWNFTREYMFLSEKYGENKMKNLFQYVVFALNFNFWIS